MEGGESSQAVPEAGEKIPIWRVVNGNDGASLADNILARWTPAGGTAWYLIGRLGPIRDLADQTGAVIDHLEYNSFGNILSESNPAAGDRFKFIGREYDPATGLYYYRARYYDPRLGRFICQNPLEFDAGDYNFYRYVRNDPIRHVDPTGTTEDFEEAVVTGLVRGGVAGAIEGFICGLADWILTTGHSARMSASPQT